MEAPRLYMAPMKGFTDHIFRNIFTEHFGGFDLAVAPFIATRKDRKIRRKYVKDLLPDHNTRLPVVPQILGKTAEDFTHLANYLCDLGYDTVNWNLGCPFPMVANKMRGAGMMPYTDLIRAFLDNAIPAMRPSLSIKIRLGWRSPEEVFRLIPVLNQYPIEEIIIHPRTGIQRYGGETDLTAFEQCAAALHHPVVFNGEIRTPEIFRQLSRRFNGVNRWMIGRWCIANPFLPVIIKNNGEDDIPENVEKIRQFHGALFQAYSQVLDGPAHILNKMKGFWCYFSLPYRNCKKAIKAIKKSNRPGQYLERVNRFFESEAALTNRNEENRDDL